MTARCPRRFAPLLVAVLLAICGCAAPLAVTRLDASEAYTQLNRTALSGEVPSDATLVVLRRHDLLGRWQGDPVAAIARLREDVVGRPDLWPELLALSELSYLQGKRQRSPPAFLAAAIYAFAYLDPGGADRPSPYDPRFRQACDIYNLSLAAAFTPPDGGTVQLASGRRDLPFGAVDVTVDESQLKWGGRTLVAFQPTSGLAVRGLQNIYRHPGLGAPLAALTDAGSAPATGLTIAGHLRVPTNMLLVMDAPRHQVARPVLRGRLAVHTIFDQQDTRVGGAAVPLEYDQTASRALSLVEATAWDREYEGFFNGGLFEQSPGQLIALQPHQPGRMPVILVHGTASSPFRWADMVNDLLEDPQIQGNFEFWFFSYASGNPIPYSALQLRRSIDDAVRQLGGSQADPALARITVIGHSQGGLLAKMLVIDPGDRLWNGVSTRRFESLKMSSGSRALLRDALFPRPVAGVHRVIFIATPQRGSYLASLSISALLGRLVTLPQTLVTVGKEVLSGNGDIVLAPGASRRFGSIYGMSPNSHYIQALSAEPLAPDVRAHSIIAVQTSGPAAEGDDGVVTYASAHVEGVDSELVVRSGHSTQSNPATIAEVRRILLLQLAAPAGPPVAAASSR